VSDQVYLDKELDRLSRAIAEASNKYSELCEAAAGARDDYELAKAKAMVKADPKTKVDIMKAEVTLVCEDVARTAHIFEAQRDAVKERLRALQAVLNAIQTRCGFLRDEMKMAGRFN
jgi:hypothetical protein